MAADRQARIFVPLRGAVALEDGRICPVAPELQT